MVTTQSLRQVPDVEAFLWAEYGGIAGAFRRAAHAMYEAANAAKGYAERFDNEKVQFLIAIAMIAGYRKAGAWGDF